ncbi:MAG: glucosaminidase domain-containing protein [Bacillus sp. (in: firmicutes)]
MVYFSPSQDGSGDTGGKGGGTGSGGNFSNSTAISILGPTLISPEHLNKYAKSINPSAVELGGLYVLYGDYYGIRGDIAFSQALLETGYFRFGGDVRSTQNNFAGIGATGTPVRGASFATPEDGVLAHLQHLFAYGSSESLPTAYPVVDPRFHLVSRGTAKTWTALNGKWAVPGTTYGQSILSIYGRIIDFAIADLKTMRGRV